MRVTVGTQGSGKTYYSVKYLSTVLEKNPQKEVFTNIDSLKFPSSSIKDFLIKLRTSYDYYQRNIDSDDRYIKIPSVVLIDESHNYFRKDDDMLVWLVTEHRHLDIDLVLITQSLLLIHYKYRIFDIIIEAYPPSATLSNSSLRYAEYSGEINANTLIRKFTLKKDKKIFDLYKSGDILPTNRPFLKWIILIIVLFSFFIALMYWFSSTFTSKDNNTTIQDTNISKNSLSSTSLNTEKSNFSDEILITILFDKSSGKYQYNSFIFDSYIYKKYSFHVVDEICYDNICSSSVLVSSAFLKIFTFDDKKKSTFDMPTFDSNITNL